MSLQTPAKIRTLQKKLYCKAKAEPEFRFYLLYDKIWREDILAHAWAVAKANGGAPGVDDMTFAGIEAAGLGNWLAGLLWLRRKMVGISSDRQPCPDASAQVPGGAP
jgi:RNA-directed DNA polymerase